MQIILKRSTLQWTKKALPFFPPSSLMKVEKSPSVLHRRDSEIAGCTKPRPNWLGSVKMPSIKRVIFGPSLTKLDLSSATHTHTHTTSGTIFKICIIFIILMYLVGQTGWSVWPTCLKMKITQHIKFYISYTIFRRNMFVAFMKFVVYFGW